MSCALRLFDVVRLARDLPGEALARGAVGTIVHLHADAAYEVEFVRSDPPGGSRVLALSREELELVPDA